MICSICVGCVVFGLYFDRCRRTAAYCVGTGSTNASNSSNAVWNMLNPRPFNCKSNVLTVVIVMFVNVAGRGRERGNDGRQMSGWSVSQSVKKSTLSLAWVLKVAPRASPPQGVQVQEVALSAHRPYPLHQQTTSLRGRYTAAGRRCGAFTSPRSATSFPIALTL